MMIAEMTWHRPALTLHWSEGRCCYRRETGTTYMSVTLATCALAQLDLINQQSQIRAMHHDIDGWQLLRSIAKQCCLHS